MPRVGMGLLGGLLYLGVARALALSFAPLVGGGAEGPKLGKTLMLLPYLGCGVFLLTAVAATNRLGLQFALTSALATAGGTSALAWMWTLLKPVEGPAALPVGGEPGLDDRGGDHDAVGLRDFWAGGGVVGPRDAA